MEDRIEERHKIVSEMIEFATKYCKKKGIKLWYNVEDFYKLETEVPAKRLKEIKEKLMEEIRCIPDCDYHALTPSYKLEIEGSEEGIVSYRIVEDLPQPSPMFPEVDMLPPEKLEDLVRVSPVDEIVNPVIEEIREEVREMEYKKMQEYAYGEYQEI